VDFAGIALPIVTIEDLVLLKALADRPQDRADIAGVLAEHGRALDRAYLRHWGSRLQIDVDELGQV
jgi:hypothetical protein